MKHFYCSSTGSPKSSGNCSASKNESIQTHLRTFENGIFISASHSNGVDTFYIFKTKGTLGEREGEKMDLISEYTFILGEEV